MLRMRLIGDVSTDALEDGGVVAYAKTDILIEEGINNALVQCVAVVDGHEVVMSDKHKIDVITIETTEEYENNFATTDDQKDIVNFVKLEKNPDIEEDEEERGGNLWIPLKPVNDMDDYQDMFKVDNDIEADDNDDAHFMRPSELPKAPMLKQEKERKSQSIETAAPVSMVFSSSSTILSTSVLLAIALSLSTLFH